MSESDVQELARRLQSTSGAMNLSRDERRGLLKRSCRFWLMLDESTRNDLIDGKCTYLEYDMTPIIDYTKPNQFFSGPSE